MINTIRKVRRFAMASLGKDVCPKLDVKPRKERFGSKYGGWDIAVGQINGDSVVYSFGVGEDASFDIALIDRFGLDIHAFDPTPKSIEWVKRQGFSDNFILHEYGIADFDGSASFNPPVHPDHVSHTIIDRPSTENRSITVPVKRLSTIMKELGHTQIDILKMDIEGAEYGVIEDCMQSDIRPRQILIEFHHRFPNIGIRKTKEAIDKIRKMGYGLFSVSISGEEFCFIRIFS